MRSFLLYEYSPASNEPTDGAATTSTIVLRTNTNIGAISQHENEREVK
jgi:hypothetical protein